MGLRRSQIPPEMLAKMQEAEHRYLEAGGSITRERYQIETPWIDRKLAGRIGKLEREEQGTFANWLNANGWRNGYVWHGTHKATTCHAGVPDFIVPVSRRTLFIEFKAAGGKLSLPQMNFQLVLEQQGLLLYIVYNAQDAIELVKETQQFGLKNV